MKKYIIILVSLVALWGEWIMAAPTAITPADFGFVKTLKKSVDYPIELIRSTAAAPANDHGGRVFTLRTLEQMSYTPLSEYAQKQIRNEVCASTLMMQTNAAVQPVYTPGSLGAFVYNDRIVAMVDDALAGAPLDVVLRKLSTASPAVKRAAAKYYAVSMAKNLQLIQAANIIWNNVALSNFYVRPDGHLSAVDFSNAKLDAGIAPKAVEWKNLLVEVVYPMYKLLFSGNTGHNEFITFVTSAGIAGALVNANNWRAHNWNEADFIGLLNRALGGNGADAANTVAGVAGLGVSGLGAAAAGVVLAAADGDFSNVDNRTFTYLNLPQNKPYMPDPAVAIPTTPVSKADLLGTAYAGVDAGAPTAGRYQFDPTLMGLFTDPATAVPYVDHQAFCVGWTGN